MAKMYGPNLVTAQLVKEALDEHWPGLSNYVNAFKIEWDTENLPVVSLRLTGLDLLDVRCPLTDVDGDGSGDDRCVLGVNHEGGCHF